MKTESVAESGLPDREEPLDVGVVMGGESREREISLKTGRAVSEALSEAPCRVHQYDTSTTLGEELTDDSIDVVFLALHGKGGEDGTIQALLEWRDIPYTGPGPQASALCMDKLRTRQLFDQVGVPSPEWFHLGPDDPIENRKDLDRMVVKPRSEGSSLGMSIVEPSGLTKAVESAREYDEDVLVEEHIDGYELTVGAVTTDEFNVFPPVGIRPDHDFFDFDTKYTKGLTEYDVPADLSESRVREIKRLTKHIVGTAETADLCRVDYIMDTSGTFKLLEINTIPGLTETSLLPKAAKVSGMDFKELVWSLVKSSWRRSECQPM